MTYYAILVVNTWTKSERLQPGIYKIMDVLLEKNRLEANCSTTNGIKNNEYKIVEIL